VLVVLLSLVETAIQKIAVGALDGSSRKVVIGFAWLAVPALFAGYFARIGWFTLIPKLFRRSR